MRIYLFRKVYLKTLHGTRQSFDVGCAEIGFHDNCTGTYRIIYERAHARI